MATVTKSRPRSKPARFCKLAHVGDATILLIRRCYPRRADALDTYTVEPLPADYGRGLLLTKPDGTSYCVNLSGADSTCDCKGFEQHGHCKHTESLLALAAAGKL